MADSHCLKPKYNPAWKFEHVFHGVRQARLKHSMISVLTVDLDEVYVDERCNMFCHIYRLLLRNVQRLQIGRIHLLFMRFYLFFNMPQIHLLGGGLVLDEALHAKGER